MINVDKFDELIENYRCGNILDTKKKLKKMNRKDRGLVIRWLNSYNSTSKEKQIGFTFALWIIEGRL